MSAEHCESLPTTACIRGSFRDGDHGKGGLNRELFVVEHGKAIGTDANIVTTYVPGDFFGELEFIGIGDVSNAHMCVCVFVRACVRVFAALSTVNF